MLPKLIQKFEAVVLLICALMLTGCAPSWWRRMPPTYPGDGSAQNESEVLGGQDAVTIDLPFQAGYQTLCTQGVGGEYSHDGNSTYYDVDLDTPNDRADIVYAPVAGTAYVHDDDPLRNFGVHVNIDLSDGTYIAIGHLSEVFVSDMQDVAAGQLIGFEGSSGASSGDHVHLGRHRGFADQDAVFGESLEGLSLSAMDDTANVQASIPTSDMTCSLSGGHYYGSLLQVPLWHPNGSLVKTPDDPRTYLIEDGAARWITTEDVFWQQNYDFADVALISHAELSCYEDGEDIGGEHSLQAVYDGTTAWLLSDSNGSQTRYALPALHWQDVLKSWGIEASTYDDLLSEEELGFSLESFTLAPTPAAFRDGTLVREQTNSAVYAVSDGIAMPVVDWNTMLLLGFGPRDILWVDDGVIASVLGRIGDCRVNAYCLTKEDVTTCGGPLGDEGVIEDDGGTDDDGTDENADTTTDGTDETVPDVGGANPSDELTLIWSMVQVPMDRITLSGEVIQGGVSQGWQQLHEETGGDHIEWVGTGFGSGDSVRFSVEYVENGTVSWSCLAPFPPGAVRGVVLAEIGGVEPVAYPVEDPESAGCGLLVTVP